MKRREFLKVNALLGAGLTGACATTGTPPRDDARMTAYLARVDATLDAIAQGNPARTALSAPELLDGPGPYAGGQALFKKSLRSLYLVSAFRDLDEEDRLHPGMQERMWRAAPEMDQAIFGVTRHLGALGPTEQRDLQRTLAARPDLVTALADDLARHGAGAGMPASRRMQLRSIAARVAWRLEKQPPSILIEEYTQKVRKVAAWTDYDLDEQTRAAESAAETLFWSQAVPDPRMVAAAPPPERPGDGAITAGLWLLGIGLGTGAVGGVLLAAGGSSSSGGLVAPGVVLTTVGGLLLISGLITLLVGGIIRSSNP